MLVLTRKLDEVVVIGEGESQVRVTVVELRGDKVRLGFAGKDGIPIHREEVYDAIQEEKRCQKQPLGKHLKSGSK